MYELNIIEEELKAVIKFNIPLIIQNISAIKEAIIEAIDKTNHLIVDHTSCEEFDISYLQILIAVQKTMNLCGKKLTIKGIEDDLFHKFLEDTGCITSDWIMKD